MLVKRLRDARKHKAARGGHAVGDSPFGFRPGDWNFEEDPTEQEVLREIARLHSEGSNPSHIARRLNDLGLRSKRGGRWHPTSVRRILGRMLRDAQRADVKVAGLPGTTAPTITLARSQCLSGPLRDFQDVRLVKSGCAHFHTPGLSDSHVIFGSVGLASVPRYLRRLVEQRFRCRESQGAATDLRLLLRWLRYLARNQPHQRRSR